MEDFKSATESLPREFWSYWVINVSSFLPMLSVANGIFTSLPIDVEAVLCDADVLNGFRKFCQPSRHQCRIQVIAPKEKVSELLFCIFPFL